MLLTDPRLLYASIFTFILFTIFAITFWSRLSKPTFINYLARTLLILTSNILVLAIAAFSVNNYGNFYISFDDLLGHQSIAVEQSNKIPTFGISLDDLRNAEFNLDGSAVIKRTIVGKDSGIKSEVYLGLPRSYVQALRTHVMPSKNYRVIEFLPGYPGHPLAWIHGIRVMREIESQVGQGKLPEFIAVFPPINISANFDAECMDFTSGPKIETWLSKDVVTFVNQYLNLTASTWGISGYSTGGWCATMLAIKHREQYSMVGSIAAYYNPALSRKISKYERDRQRLEYNLDNYLQDERPVDFFIVDSVDDSESHPSTKKFIEKITGKFDLTTVKLRNSGHNLEAWKKVIPTMLRWFGTKIQESQSSSLVGS